MASRLLYSPVMFGSSSIRRSTLFSAACLLVVLAVTPVTEGATRLTYEIGGKPTEIAWSTDAFPLTFIVDRGSLGGSHAPVRSALDSWEAASEGTVGFRIEEGSGLRAAKDGKNAIFVSDSLLQNNGFLAFTTTWFDDAGRILEADLQIDRSQIGNLRALVMHELGHALGFDHSPVLSSAMYPFVSTEGSFGLDADDVSALRNLYATSALAGSGMLSGTVRDGTSTIWGAQVVVVDAHGQPVVSTLSGLDGSFRLGPLQNGEYSVYAEPLNGPVTPRNFSGVWRGISSDGFRTGFYPSRRETVRIREGEERASLELRVQQAPVSLNPKWIGKLDAGGRDLVLDSVATTVRQGERVHIAVGGDGFVSGMTTFEIPCHDIERVSDFRYGTNYVWAEFQVASGAPTHSIVIIVESGNETAALTGGLKIAAADESARRRAVGRR
jgi:hypothetical protein